MNKSQHLNKSKQFLRKIINHRRHLLKMGVGKPANEEMIKTISEIEYYLGTISTFDRMMNLLSKKEFQTRLQKQVIPKNKPGWIDELNTLISKGNIISGRTAKQLELLYD